MAKNNTAKASKATSIPTVKANAGKPAKAVKAVLGMAILMLEGVRGFCARLASYSKAGQDVTLTATQDNVGLSLKSATPCKIENGILTGKGQGLLECGGYVNGKRSGAKATLMSGKAFAAQAKSGIVTWKADANDGYPCLYIGNPDQKGMLAVITSFNGKTLYVWHAEQDSNSHNKHERARVIPMSQVDAKAQAKAKAGVKALQSLLATVKG